MIMTTKVSLCLQQFIFPLNSSHVSTTARCKDHVNLLLQIRKCISPYRNYPQRMDSASFWRRMKHGFVNACELENDLPKSGPWNRAVRKSIVPIPSKHFSIHELHTLTTITPSCLPNDALFQHQVTAYFSCFLVTANLIRPICLNMVNGKTFATNI